jgi:hypothetical protein
MEKGRRGGFETLHDEKIACGSFALRMTWLKMELLSRPGNCESQKCQSAGDFVEKELMEAKNSAGICG